MLREEKRSGSDICSGLENLERLSSKWEECFTLLEEKDAGISILLSGWICGYKNIKEISEWKTSVYFIFIVYLNLSVKGSVKKINHVFLTPWALSDVGASPSWAPVSSSCFSPSSALWVTNRSAEMHSLPLRDGAELFEWSQPPFRLTTHIREPRLSILSFGWDFLHLY